MSTDVLKCETADGVLKKLAVFTLVYNLVRLVMLLALQQQGVPPDRIRFVEAPRKPPRKPPASALATRRDERSRADAPGRES